MQFLFLLHLELNDHSLSSDASCLWFSQPGADLEPWGFLCWSNEMQVPLGDKFYTNAPQTALIVLKALPFTSKTVPDTETNKVTPLIKCNMLTVSVSTSISHKTPTKTYLSNIQTLVTFHYTDWFMGIRDPYNGLLQSLYNELGSIIPIYPKTTRAFFHCSLGQIGFVFLTPSWSKICLPKAGLLNPQCSACCVLLEPFK